MSAEHLRTPEAVARRAESRRSRIAGTRSTQRPGSERTDLEVGDRVVCRREMPPAGTWSRYNGRTGYVVVLNAEEYENGSTYVEIGVSWSVGADIADARADAWFRADELELVE